MKWNKKHPAVKRVMIKRWLRRHYIRNKLKMGDFSHLLNLDLRELRTVRRIYIERIPR